MKKLLIALAAVLITATSYGQGQVVFANLVGSPGSPTATVDAPVFLNGSTTGPGDQWQAQLFVVGANNSLTPVPGALSPFRKPGTGAAAVADRYWSPSPTVTVPGVDSGQTGTFVVGVYPISFASFDAANTAGQAGKSASFQVAVGGGLLAPANLTTLKSFTVTTVPEPSILALGALGASALLLRRRK